MGTPEPPSNQPTDVPEQARGALDLDPAATGTGSPRPSGQPIVDTRRYRWMIGIFGLALVVAVSVYTFATHGIGTSGVPAGKRLHFFAVPLAASTLNGDANLNPPCSLARHDPRALNICLLTAHAPLALAFFVAGSRDCERQVDALQALSVEFPPSAVQFAAVAIRAGHAQAAAVVRAHHWTIPVAYDRDGAVGDLYNVDVCPIVELAYRGGIVADRLIGDHWLTPSTLAVRVRALFGASAPRDRLGARIARARPDAGAAAWETL